MQPIAMLDEDSTNIDCFLRRLRIFSFSNKISIENAIPFDDTQLYCVLKMCTRLGTTCMYADKLYSEGTFKSYSAQECIILGHHCRQF